MENNGYKFTFKKFCIHLSTIVKHKHYVFKYCRMCGIPFRGLVHDLSKFSPAEFITNVKYTEKGKSPITIQKELYGYCPSWLHHKSHNKHHYEYWMDRFDDGCYVTRMPFDYTLEMMCDFIGASYAYNKSGLSKEEVYKNEYEWWQKNRTIKNMHPDNTKFLDTVFELLISICNHDKVYISDESGRYIMEDIELKSDKDLFDYYILKFIYNSIVCNSTNPIQIPLKDIKRGE